MDRRVIGPDDARITLGVNDPASLQTSVMFSSWRMARFAICHRVTPIRSHMEKPLGTAAPAAAQRFTPYQHAPFIMCG
jgi:hypothetical protein